MSKRLRITRIAFCFIIYFGAAGVERAQAQVPSPLPQATEVKASPRTPPLCTTEDRAAVSERRSPCPYLDELQQNS